MSLFTNTTRLRIAAIVEIARSAKPLNVKHLAKRQGIESVRKHETFLQGAVDAKILKGVRGPRGGYLLARDADKITVADIMKVIAGLSESNPEPPIVVTPVSLSIDAMSFAADQHMAEWLVAPTIAQLSRQADETRHVA